MGHFDRDPAVGCYISGVGCGKLRRGDDGDDATESACRRGWSLKRIVMTAGRFRCSGNGVGACRAFLKDFLGARLN